MNQKKPQPAMYIKVVAAHIGLFGMIEVGEGQEFTVTLDTEEQNREPLKARLNEILSEEALPLCVPMPVGAMAGVAYYERGESLYPHAVASELSHKKICHLVVRGEVVEAKINLK